MIKLKNKVLYTIGHSNHAINDFIGLLKQHGANIVIDVRSDPYSHYCPQFNKDILNESLRSAGISYLFMGNELGARSIKSAINEGGKINLQSVAKREEFQKGLKRLLDVASQRKVALMCAEKEPLECHRMILICRMLKEYELSIKHILSDGSIESHGDAELRMVRMLKIGPTLFEPNMTKKDLVERAYEEQSEKISFNPTELDNADA